MTRNRHGAGRIFIETFGCQMNEYDSDRVMRMFSGLGWEPADDLKDADVIFLNTCSIREKAEQKVHSYLGRLRPLKNANPDLIIAVGGCVAQQFGERFLKRTPYLDIVIGTHAIHRFPEFIDKVKNEGGRFCYTKFDYDLTPPPKLTGRKKEVTAFLTIMQGCNNFCAYCIVPYVRGREISRKPDDIVREAEDLLAGGVKEITLLGQNVNSYGTGLEPSINFPRLIEKIAALKGLQRLRFTTSHPKDLSPELIRAIADIEPLCEHIHLPVQAGSNRILKAMRRVYSREDYLGKVETLRDACPDIAITTDVIVGFPGETEADFRETIDLVEYVRYDGMFSFKYSDRDMTRASKMNDGLKLDEAEKGRRLAILQDLQRNITIEINQGMIGRDVDVLVEGPGRREGQLTGRTRGNKIVNFEGPLSLVGETVKLSIVDAWANSLLGRFEPWIVKGEATSIA